MKFTFTIKIAFFSLFLLGISQGSFAQTQAEIEAMQNENTKDVNVEEKKTKAEKDAEKAAKKEAAEIEKAIKKAEKDLERANKKAAKSASDTDSSEKEKPAKKEKTEKPAKEKPAKAEKVKDGKPAKVKKEKTEKEKTEKTAKSKPVKTVSSASRGGSSRTNLMNKPFKTWSFDIGLNATNPQTDIRYNDFFGTITPKNEYKYGGQLRVTKMFDNAIGLQAQFSYNRLQGVFDTLVPFAEDRRALEAAGINEGIWFRNNVIQGSLNIYWNISNTVFNVNKYYRSLRDKKPIKKRWFSLYAYTGIGFSIFDPHVMRLSDNAPVSVADAFPGVKFQTNRTTEVVIPAALGAKFKLSKTIDLGFEFGYNFLFSDKLDGFNYNHPGRIKHDGYSTGSLVLSFKLGGKKNDKEHIEWTNSIEPVFEEIAKIGSIKKKVDRLAKDEDEDGISDYFDKDTETLEGTTVGADGKALDTDGDGVPNDIDMDLFTAKGAEVDEQGRAIDTDGDGVPDYLDLEDGTSDGEFVNFQGRSIDDNITVKTSENELRNIAMPSIFFDTDKANIKREYEDELFQMALTIKRNKGLRFVLEGHCDERGSDEYNAELGRRRSEAVKNYLVENYKLDPALFTLVSKGRAEAMSPRYNINRRVDVVVAQ
ncbi:MAG: OmpA family protein [Chitinophagales bacterium]